MAVSPSSICIQAMYVSPLSETFSTRNSFVSDVTDITHPYLIQSDVIVFACTVKLVEPYNAICPVPFAYKVTVYVFPTFKIVFALAPFQGPF